MTSWRGWRKLSACFGKALSLYKALIAIARADVQPRLAVLPGKLDRLERAAPSHWLRAIRSYPSDRTPGMMTAAPFAGGRRGNDFPVVILVAASATTTTTAAAAAMEQDERNDRTQFLKPFGFAPRPIVNVP